MPRRRRRNDSRKESLEFEESPIHIVHKLPSPVFASDHPATADVVPVNPDLSYPWVRVINFNKTYGQILLAGQ